MGEQDTAGTPFEKGPIHKDRALFLLRSNIAGDSAAGEVACPVRHKASTGPAWFACSGCCREGPAATLYRYAVPHDWRRSSGDGAVPGGRDLRRGGRAVAWA